MISISRIPVGGGSRGFTLVELLVGLALAATVAVAVAPLWASLEDVGADETDRTVQSLQGRVAIARFERDLRLASAAGCPFAVQGPVLEASGNQVVFLERTGDDGVATLVEWEIVNGALMRRWGPCPVTRPLVHGHSLYVDHKTMLDDVAAGSVFAYVVGGVPATGPVSGQDLDRIEAVVLDARVVSEEAGPGVKVSTTARVAR
ncbi:MAG: prepilin-type N-terminal cleavage/methylation domain-containing protein [Actinomycetia bacterium]|nr:prepilin-type N-terminal cleavage/methylation domain-containing protein [Actinomycetes bacterium]